jgi:hypothetical protein
VARRRFFASMVPRPHAHELKFAVRTAPSRLDAAGVPLRAIRFGPAGRRGRHTLQSPRTVPCQLGTAITTVAEIDAAGPGPLGRGRRRGAAIASAGGDAAGPGPRWMVEIDAVARPCQTAIGRCGPRRSDPGTHHHGQRQEHPWSHRRAPTNLTRTALQRPMSNAASGPSLLNRVMPKRQKSRLSPTAERFLKAFIAPSSKLIRGAATDRPPKTALRAVARDVDQAAIELGSDGFAAFFAELLALIRSEAAADGYSSTRELRSRATAHRAASTATSAALA